MSSVGATGKVGSESVEKVDSGNDISAAIIRRSDVRGTSSGAGMNAVRDLSNRSGNHLRVIDAISQARTVINTASVNETLALKVTTKLLEKLESNSDFIIPKFPTAKKFSRDISMEYATITNREFMGKPSATFKKETVTGSLAKNQAVDKPDLVNTDSELLMIRFSKSMDEHRQSVRIAVQTSVEEKIDSLKAMGVDQIRWSNQKTGVSPEAASIIKELRTQAIMEPAAKMAALEMAKSLGKNFDITDVKEIPSQEKTGIEKPLAGREYNFEIKYLDQGQEKSLKIFFHAPGSDTNTSDIDLGIKTIPPNMFAQAWLNFDKCANQCLESLRSQLEIKGIGLENNLAKSFDINLYSSGFIFNETAKKSVFSPHTQAGLKNNMIADLGLGMIRSVDNILQENDLNGKSGAQIKQMFDKSFPSDRGDYGKAKNFAITATLENLQDLAKEILQINQENPTFSSGELQNLVEGLNYNSFESFKNGTRLNDNDFENLAKLTIALKDIKENNADIYESAVKANFLKTHSEVIKLNIAKGVIQEKLHDLSDNHVDPSLRSISDKLIPERRVLNKEADDISLKAVIFQGRGTTFADEAYNNAAALHKTVEGRQMGLPQFNSPMGSLGSIESDFGFINHHHEEDLSKFLLASGKYLSRFMDQVENIKLKDWGDRNIGVNADGVSPGKKVSGAQLQVWARKLEEVKNGVGDFKSLKTTEEKMEQCLILTEELFGANSNLSPDNVKKIISDVRDKVVGSIDRMNEMEKFKTKI